MPRRKRMRRVVAPPKFRGYKPYGNPVVEEGAVELLYEEYEAIKLADYDLMSHQEACVLMGVSRPTFARVYESARRKIAQALVETREIKSVFGNAQLDKSWFQCAQCHSRFNVPKSLDGNHCPICRSECVAAIE